MAIAAAVGLAGLWTITGVGAGPAQADQVCGMAGDVGYCAVWQGTSTQSTFVVDNTAGSGGEDIAGVTVYPPSGTGTVSSVSGSPNSCSLESGNWVCTGSIGPGGSETITVNGGGFVPGTDAALQLSDAAGTPQAQQMVPFQAGSGTTGPTGATGATGATGLTGPAGTGGTGGSGGGTGTTNPCPGHPSLSRPCADYAVSITSLGVTTQHDLDPCLKASVRFSNNGPDETAAHGDVQMTGVGGDIAGYDFGLDGFSGGALSAHEDEFAGSVQLPAGGTKSGTPLDCVKLDLPSTTLGFLSYLLSSSRPPATVSISASVTGANDPVTSNNGPVTVTHEIPDAVMNPDLGTLMNGGAGLLPANGAGKASDEVASVGSLRDRLAAVEVAILRVRFGARAAAAASACEWLKASSGRFVEAPSTGGVCEPSPVWLRVSGLSRWKFPVSRLPKGRYVAYARAVDADGVTDIAFNSVLHNRLAFTVR